MARGNFIFYNSFFESIDALTDDLQVVNAAMGAIVRYGVRGELYEGDNPIIRCAMLQAMPLIDANRAKTNRGGTGAPIGNTNAKKQTSKQTLEQTIGLKKQTIGLKKTNHSLSDIDIDIDRDIDIDKDIDIEKEKESIIDASSNANAFDAAQDAQDEEQDEDIPTPSDTDVAMQVVDYYNTQIKANDSKLHTCSRMSPARRRSILARVREVGVDQVKAMIDKAVVSHFLNYGASNAPMGIDWLIRPNNFLKVLEGNYDGDGSNSRPTLMAERLKTLPQDNSTYGKFNKWAFEKYPYLMGHAQKILTSEQLDKLLNRYDKQDIFAALKSMEADNFERARCADLYVKLTEKLNRKYGN